jgi:hypothetical protein
MLITVIKKKCHTLLSKDVHYQWINHVLNFEEGHSTKYHKVQPLYKPVILYHILWSSENCSGHWHVILFIQIVLHTIYQFNLKRIHVNITYT